MQQKVIALFDPFALFPPKPYNWWQEPLSKLCLTSILGSWFSSHCFLHKGHTEKHPIKIFLYSFIVSLIISPGKNYSSCYKFYRDFIKKLTKNGILLIS